MPDDPIFRALADASRRLLLDQLFERDGRSLSELEPLLPMSRFGVMKHLRILEGAGLVVSRKVGREKLHYLNPLPIQAMYDRWIGKYAAPRVSALADLKAALEGETRVSVDVAARPTQVYDLFIKATPEQIWTAITTPEFTARYYFGARISTTLEAGTPLNYLMPDSDALMIEGEVVEADPPRRLVHTFRSHFNPDMLNDAPSRVTWELASVAGGMTRLTVIHDQFDAETATYTGTANGWPWLLSNLKTLLETGETLPPVMPPVSG